MQAVAAGPDDGARTVASSSQRERTQGAQPRPGRATTPAAVPSAEDIEQFLSMVAHELRTPLSVTASAADTLTALLAQDEVDHTEIGRIADVIQRHSRLSARLVARLSLAHDIGKDAVTLETEELDLARLVEEIVSDVAAFVLPERTVTVSANGPVRATVDRASISEIVFNLLANAHKYSTTVAAIEVLVDRDDQRARIIVRDQGSGVSPGDTEAIFEPYVQSGPNRGGVGLGLYVSRGLARAHGGELSVRPATDIGSEFVLTLPTATA